MRVLVFWGAATGFAILGQTIAASFLPPGPWLAPFSIAEYAYLVAAVAAAVLALRRGAGAWFFAAYVAYALADGLYGFYLVRTVGDPQALRLPAPVLLAHGVFGLGYGLWGLWLGLRRRGV
jgi:hypothetical protein